MMIYEVRGIKIDNSNGIFFAKLNINRIQTTFPYFVRQDIH